jgi:hypothetical protein
MNSEGTAFVLQYEKEALPDFVGHLPLETPKRAPLHAPSPWSTLFVSGGRKDKISKGDVAGLFFKQGMLAKEDLGIIELKTDCAFIGVKTAALEQLLPRVNNQKLKEKKVRVTLV